MTRFFLFPMTRGEVHATPQDPGISANNRRLLAPRRGRTRLHRPGPRLPERIDGLDDPDSSPNPALGDSGTVSAAGGLATVAESQFAIETDLFLSFTVPTGASSLQFSLNSVSADSTVADNTANGYTPDSFGVSLLDPNTGMSLVQTVNMTTDSFYTRDIVDGVTRGRPRRA